MDKLIKKLLNDGIITPAQARAIEIFLIGTFFSFVLQLLDFVTKWLQGENITLDDLRTFLVAFLTSLSASLVAGLRKYLRDLEKKMLDDIDKKFSNSKNKNEKNSL